ncbi:MAG: DUF6702 family protein [Flavobacteriales bacterium]
MKTALLSLGLVVAAAPHDFFVSILTIHHNEANKTLDLTWRMTAHDMEHALSNVAQLKLASTQEHPKADSILNAYFMERLHLFQEDRELRWKWIGKELESENLYCYMQVEGVSTANDLSVSNSLLQDVFAEQDNIVHLEAQGRTLSYHFVLGTPMYTFKLE